MAGPSPDTSGVLHQLFWYYSPDGNVTVLLEDDSITDIDTYTFSNGIGISSRLRVRDGDAILPGYYWCQIAVANDSFVNVSATVADFSPLNPSTKTRLRPPDDPMYYGLPPCPPSTYLNNADIKCADLSSQETAATSPITSKLLPTPVLSQDTPIPSVHTCSNGSNSSAERNTIIPLEGLIAGAVGVPIFVAILVLILVVVMSVRKSGREKPETDGRLPAGP